MKDATLVKKQRRGLDIWTQGAQGERADASLLTLSSNRPPSSLGGAECRDWLPAEALEALLISCNRREYSRQRLQGQEQDD